MPLADVTGSSGMVVPEQYGPTDENAGVMLGLIVIVRFVVVAHWPDEGVNV